MNPVARSSVVFDVSVLGGVLDSLFYSSVENRFDGDVIFPVVNITRVGFSCSNRAIRSRVYIGKFVDVIGVIFHVVGVIFDVVGIIFDVVGGVFDVVVVVVDVIVVVVFEGTLESFSNFMASTRGGCESADDIFGALIITVIVITFVVVVTVVVVVFVTVVVVAVVVVIVIVGGCVVFFESGTMYCTVQRFIFFLFCSLHDRLAWNTNVLDYFLRGH